MVLLSNNQGTYRIFMNDFQDFLDRFPGLFMANSWTDGGQMLMVYDDPLYVTLKCIIAITKLHFRRRMRKIDLS